MLQTQREETEGKRQMLLSPRKNGLTSLFKEVGAFENPLNHVTVIAENSWEFLRGIISGNAFRYENKETVTVMLINSEDPWKL